MTRIKRPAATAGAAVLLAFSLTACGGGGPGADAPTDASEDDFCKAYLDANEEFASGGGDEEAWETYQEGVEKLADVGTPKDITEEQRNGFEVWVDVVLDTEWDDAKDAGEEVPVDDEDDAKDVTSFVTWATETCFEIPEIPSDLPTDIETE